MTNKQEIRSAVLHILHVHGYMYPMTTLKYLLSGKKYSLKCNIRELKEARAKVKKALIECRKENPLLRAEIRAYERLVK